MNSEFRGGSSVDDRLTSRREHLMTEICAPPTPSRSVGSWRIRRRAALIAASVAVASTAGLAAAYAHSQSSSTPNIIYFNRLQVRCDAQWTCLTKAASTLRRPVLGPTSGHPIGDLVADGSPLNADGQPETDENMLSYIFRPDGSSSTVELEARAGHDSAMGDVLPPANVAANGSTITVAGEPAYIATADGGSQLWVTIAGMHYRFSSTDPTSTTLTEVAANLKTTSE